MKPSDMARYESVILERLTFHSMQTISGDVLRHAGSTAFVAECADALILRLVAEIAGKNEQIFEVQWPATWWDAVADRWYPAWLKKRYPPQFKGYRVDKQTLFPSIEIPRHEAVVRLNIASWGNPK